MLYLKSLTLHRFKSFKHAELLFSKGFTCVVGPNGSGKSNICDALLFGLGENSLKRMRAHRLDYLITLPTSKSSDLRKAYVRINLGGDEEMEVLRGVRSDGKSMYKINGKRMTRQEALDILGRHGVHADETNTITQGEINRLIELNPKGRRELIDIASGIEEFERKKEESLKELEKVSQAISGAQIVLDERMGFLKELEAEKQAAEKYLEMTSRLKALNYSILLSRKKEAEAMLTEYTKASDSVSSKKAEAEATLGLIKERIEKFNSERQRLTKDLGESAKAMGGINAQLEAIRMELAKIDLSNSNSAAMVAEAEKSIKALCGEAESSKQKIDANSAEMQMLMVKISEFTQKLGKSGLGKKETPLQTSNLDDLNAAVKDAESALEKLNEESLKLKTEISSLSAGKESLLERVSSAENSSKSILSKKTEAGKHSKELESRQASISVAAKTLEIEISSIAKEISGMEEKSISLREQKASSQSRSGAIYDKIMEKFGKEKGFYGKASELCTYETKYSNAVDAAAGARFDYIVVDTMATANSMIKYLKENSLGRATFIPMRELMLQEESASKGKQVISVIESDEKFRKVFNFIFWNTCLVGDSGEAKSLGLGRQRYVTLGGEVIEQSGIISGGSQQRRVSTAGIEKELKEINERLSSMRSQLAEKNERLSSNRKEAAYAEMELKSHSKGAVDLEAELKRLEAEKASFSSTLKKASEAEARLHYEIEEIESEKQKESAKLDSLRKEFSSTYNKTIELSKNIAKYGLSKEEVEKLEAMRKESESLKIKNAELQKENEMLEEKITGIEKELSTKRKSMSDSQKSIKENQKKGTELEKSKKEIETKINTDNEQSKKIYAKISALDTEVAKATNEQSRASAEQAGIERQSTEVSLKKSQVEIRVNDLKAELAIYKDEITQINKDVSEMEKEVIVLNAKVSELGNVNLKAPEAFNEKKKSADEAHSKAETLDNERQAVLKMIEEIDSKKLQTFMATLNDVAKNFSRLYNYIFPGSASIRLENPKDPFNSGLDIAITTEKSTKIITSMSGGEKSLLSLILIFSIHMCKPSPLYIFDEVDAALDKENSRKLSQLIKEMSKDAQFIVVSHNDSLIVNADTAVGVAKSNDESHAVGIEVSSMTNKK